MLSTILTHPLFLASLVSFFLGSFGYILIQMWLRPVLRYRRAKRLTSSDLKKMDEMDPTRLDAASELKKQLRQHSDRLSRTYHETLPTWYQLLLKKRNEDPIQAATILMKLANTRNREHAGRQIEQIVACLNLKNITVGEEK